jgi:hypothetical protein
MFSVALKLEADATILPYLDYKSPRDLSAVRLKHQHIIPFADAGNNFFFKFRRAYVNYSGDW